MFVERVSPDWWRHVLSFSPQDGTAQWCFGTNGRDPWCFQHIREWHQRGSRWRRAALPWSNRAAFLRRMARRVERRLRQLGPGAHRIDLTVPEVFDGNARHVATEMVMAREEHVLGHPLHHSTRHGLACPPRLWQSAYWESDTKYVPSRFAWEEMVAYAHGTVFVPANKDQGHALLRLVQEARDSEGLDDPDTQMRLARWRAGRE